MTRLRAAIGCLLLVLVASVGAGAQRTALDSLADESARHAARYADRRTAMADGYRRIGLDFPGMGEHWLNPVELFANRIDVARPTMLSYATIAGEPTLVGLGFVLTTEQESLPGGTPGWPDAWHEHSGLLSEESGARTGRAGASRSTTHVWVLHIWAPLENPEGRFVPDNWALPFARVSLVAPTGVDADMGRAFSLALGGDTYLRVLLTDAGLHGPDRPTAALTDEAIDAAGTRSRLMVERARASQRVTAEDAVELRAIWGELSARLRLHLGEAVDPILAPPHHGGGPGHPAPTDERPRPALPRFQARRTVPGLASEGHPEARGHPERASAIPH